MKFKTRKPNAVPPGRRIIQKFGILKHYELLSKGLISVSDLVYFFSVTLLFIVLCESRIEKS